MPAPDANSVNSLNNIGWVAALFHGFAQYTQTVNKFVSGALGGVAALFDLYGFYEAYRNAEPDQQRKTKLATYFMGFALNTFYGCSAILRLFSMVGLSLIAIGVDLVALARISYTTHRARKAVNAIKQEMKEAHHTFDPLHSNARFERARFNRLPEHLKEAREHRFQSKVEVGYTVASLLTSGLFIAGFAFPPFFMVGLGVLIATKVVQFIDYRVDLGISRWFANLWNHVTNRKKSAATEVVLEYPEEVLYEAPVKSASGRKNTTFGQQKGMTGAYARLFAHGRSEQMAELSSSLAIRRTSTAAKTETIRPR